MHGTLPMVKDQSGEPARLVDYFEGQAVLFKGFVDALQPSPDETIAVQMFWVHAFAKAIRDVCEVTNLQQGFEHLRAFQRQLIAHVLTLKWLESERLGCNVGLLCVLQRIHVQPADVVNNGERHVSLIAEIPYLGQDELPAQQRQYCHEMMEVVGQAPAAAVRQQQVA